MDLGPPNRLLNSDSCCNTPSQGPEWVPSKKRSHFKKTSCTVPPENL